jgi:hypothetical protein
VGAIAIFLGFPHHDSPLKSYCQPVGEQESICPGQRHHLQRDWFPMSMGTFQKPPRKCQDPDRPQGPGPSDTFLGLDLSPTSKQQPGAKSPEKLQSSMCLRYLSMISWSPPLLCKCHPQAQGSLEGGKSPGSLLLSCLVS